MAKKSKKRAKRTGKRRKKGKRRATPAQLRALKKAHAALRRKRAGGKRRRKTSRRRSSASGVAAHYHSGARALAARLAGGGVESHYHSGARSYAAGIGSFKPAKRRGVAKRRRFKLKKGKALTAAAILKMAKAKRSKAYICAGPKRTGCGGGKKGAHVVGVLR